MEAYQRRYRWHLRFARLRRGMRLLALLILTIGLVYAAYILTSASAPPPVAGTADAIDGDSLRVTQADGRVREMRLAGIDAVEYRQTCHDVAGREWACGKEARGALATLVRSGVRCEVDAEDRFQRGLAHCRTPQGQDIAARLVAEGWAVAGDGDTSSRFAASFPYQAEERSAREARRGIWRGTFMRPREWRETVAAANKAAVQAANDR